MRHDVLAREGIVVFGDSAHPNNVVMITMFRGRNLPAWAALFNATLAKVRVSVKWGDAQVCANFAYVDWSRQLKIELMQVEAIWPPQTASCATGAGTRSLTTFAALHQRSMSTWKTFDLMFEKFI